MDGNLAQRRMRPCLDVARLEQRILLSATPLLAMGDGDAAVDARRTPQAPLAASGSPDVTSPVAHGLGDYVDGEDANNAVIQLNDYFTDDTDTSLTYAILNVDNPSLFDDTRIEIIGAGSKLILDHAADAFGEAILTIRATDDAGNFVDDQLHVVLLPVNDRPTTTGLADIVINEGTSTSVLNLFDAFDDLEDADHQLTYSISQNTNPDLFSSIDIDAVHGTLTFHYTPDANGSAQITIRATDTEGAFVEMSTAGASFPIYNHLFGDPGVHHPDLPLQEMGFVTSYWLFPQVNGVYQYDTLNEPLLRWYLQNYTSDAPFLINIENEFFNNTPAGRDRFAEVFAIVHDERPDLTEFGLYRIMPERSWFFPVNADRAREDAARGLATYFSGNYASFTQAEADWQARNDLFLTEPVSPQFGGTPLSEMVGMIVPSLYTSYRDDSGISPIRVHATLDPGQNSISLEGTLPYDGMRIAMAAANGAQLPAGLATNTAYYVVNQHDGLFQLAAEKGGDPIDFGSVAAGDIYASILDQRFLLHDPAVVYWESYARGNISEARQFGHTVLPWLSPSISGVGSEYLDKNFFRMQLDLMFELGDGVGLYDAGTQQGALAANHGWWGRWKNSSITCILPRSSRLPSIPSMIRPCSRDRQT